MHVNHEAPVGNIFLAEFLPNQSVVSGVTTRRVARQKRVFEHNKIELYVENKESRMNGLPILLPHKVFSIAPI